MRFDGTRRNPKKPTTAGSATRPRACAPGTRPRRCETLLVRGSVLPFGPSCTVFSRADWNAFRCHLSAFKCLFECNCTYIMRNGRTFHYVNAPFARKNLTWGRTRRRRQPAAWASSCGVARARDAAPHVLSAARLPCGHDGGASERDTPPSPRGDPLLSHHAHRAATVGTSTTLRSAAVSSSLAVASPSRRRCPAPSPAGARDAAPAAATARSPRQSSGCCGRERGAGATRTLPPPASERARMGCDGESASEHRAPPDKTQTRPFQTFIKIRTHRQYHKPL